MKIYQMAKEPDGSIMNPEDGGSMYLHNIRSHYQTPPCNHGMKFYFITFKFILLVLQLYFVEYERLGAPTHLIQPTSRFLT